MADVRSLAAAGLGVALGVLCLAYPEVLVRAHTAGRLPHDRGGEYGSEPSAPARWRLLVRLAGVALLLVGGYIGYAALVGGESLL